MKRCAKTGCNGYLAWDSWDIFPNGDRRMACIVCAAEFLWTADGQLAPFTQTAAAWTAHNAELLKSPAADGDGLDWLRAQPIGLARLELKRLVLAGEIRPTTASKAGVVNRAMVYKWLRDANRPDLLENHDARCRASKNARKARIAA